MSTVPSRLFTESEYLARERMAEFRSEFYRGETFAMAGATREHNLISANVNRTLGNQLASRPCEVYQSDKRVRITATGLYTYPDVVVGCGKLQFLDDEGDVLLNPLVVVEVLSESTAAYDCGTKATHYRRLESLQEFILIDSHVAAADHYVREAGESWRITPVEGLSGIIRLNCIDCHLPLAEAYAKVQLHADAWPLLRPMLKPGTERHH